MKKVTLIVPDVFTHTSGGSDWSSSEEVPVNADTMRSALITNDYHENYYFRDSETVRVLAVEDSDGE